MNFLLCSLYHARAYKQYSLLQDTGCGKEAQAICLVKTSVSGIGAFDVIKNGTQWI